jgi:hypothetical protein
LLALWISLLVCSGLANAINVKTGEYKLPAAVDLTVRSGLATELWGQVWHPGTGGPFPLIVMLHGNHETCGKFNPKRGARVDDNIQYTNDGTCPDGYVPVPSHLGYAYLANDLASHGYLVVSINANRGINAADGIDGDYGLNLVRGRLVLRTMQELARWNAGTVATPSSLGFSLLDQVDFSHVGLMGHSRGGEGMRAAVAQYRDLGSPWPPRIGTVGFEAMFEIAPVDGQSDRVLDASGLHWNVILPGCDGDVSSLEGVRPFDRMLKNGGESAAFRKSTLEVFGANHNFYNSEWQFSETTECQGQTKLFPDYPGSEEQRTTAAVPFRNFMWAFVGPDKKRILGRIFDPSYPLPSPLPSITQYARGYRAALTPGETFTVDDFSNSTGTSSNGIANLVSGLARYRHRRAGYSHDPVQRAALVRWQAPGGFLQLNAAAPDTPADVSAYKSLGFRIALECFGKLCESDPNPTGDVNFTIALANADGSFSDALALKDYAVVRRPVGTLVFDVFESTNILQSVRIPLADFTGADLARIVGVRFIFNRTGRSSIYLADVGFETAPAGPGGLPPLAVSIGESAEGKATAMSTPVDVNLIAAIRKTRLTEGGRTGEAAVEIEFRSSRAFPVTDSLPILRLGTKTFRLSRFAGGNRRGLIFSLAAEEFAAIPDKVEAEIKIGRSAVWRFGALHK